MNRIISFLSLGRRYYAASLLYLGLTLFLGSFSHDFTPIYASGTGCPEQACPSGQQCCKGTCISSSEVCCEDGSHGASSSGGKVCGCGSCCADEQCTKQTPTTYGCES